MTEQPKDPSVSEVENADGRKPWSAPRVLTADARLATSPFASIPGADRSAPGAYYGLS